MTQLPESQGAPPRSVGDWLALCALVIGGLAWAAMPVCALSWSSAHSAQGTNALFLGVACALGAMVLGIIARGMDSQSRRAATTAIVLGASLLVILLIGGLLLFAAASSLYNGLSNLKSG